MYSLKIYNGFFSETPAIKIDEIRNIEIDQFIDSFDILNIIVDYYIDQNGLLNCSGLQEFQKIRLIKTTNLEEVVFEGFIYNISPDFKSVKIMARDFKGLLDSKVLFTAKNYVNQNLTYILNDLLTDLNNRSSWDTTPETWSFQLDADVTGITKTFDKGISYFNIFQELWLIVNKYWTVENGVILFKQILGEDKTTGENFTELVYNKNAPDENNIANIKVEWFGTLKNVVLSSTTNESNTQSINTYGRLEEYNDIEGDELSNYVNKMSKTQTIYNFDVNFNLLNTELKVWDKISVSVNTGVEFLDISGDLFITKRKVKIEGNEILVVNVDTSEIAIKKNLFTNTLNYLQDNVKKLLLQ